MSDDDKLGLRPASVHKIQETLSFALRYAGRKRVHHADDVMAASLPSAWYNTWSCSTTCR